MTDRLEKTLLVAALAGLLASPAALAEERSAVGEKLTIEMFAIDAQGLGAPVGTVTAEETKWGTLFTPALSGLAGGGALHGFHIHANGDCGPAEKDGSQVAGLAAGGHYDPSGSGQHLGPYAKGHLGDLPPLFVDAEGNATTPVLAPRVELDDVTGRALMVHQGGDNYADHPHPLGGGGPRLYCGVAP